MARIAVFHDPSYAPCSFLLTREVNGAFDYFDEANTRLVQIDFDFPGVAANLGFVPCSCGATDGTVDCEHRTASAMIAEARAFLLEHEGEAFDDPGYFDEG